MGSVGDDKRGSSELYYYSVLISIDNRLGYFPLSPNYSALVYLLSIYLCQQKLSISKNQKLPVCSNKLPNQEGRNGRGGEIKFCN